MNEKARTRRTQAERTQQRKEQVIRAAIRFFGQNGYHGANLNEIAKAAGVTTPGLLHHFHTKTHLLMDVLAERDRIDRERFHTMPTEGTESPLIPLQNLMEYNETVPGLVQLFTVLAAESIDSKHPSHNFFKKRYQNLREQSIATLKDAQTRGEIRDDIPAEDLVVLLFAIMDGLQVQWLYEPQEIRMSRLFDQFINLVKVK